MEYQTEEHIMKGASEETSIKTSLLLPAAILIFTLALAIVGMYVGGFKANKAPQKSSGSHVARISPLGEAVLPSSGVVLPVSWGNLGVKLAEAGAIHPDAFKAIYAQRGEFTDEYQNLLLGNTPGKLKITKANSGYLLNLFWALGLANKNDILEKGEMTDRNYGGAGNFASTGGWTLAKGDAMDHYSRHTFFSLTPEQQALVEKISSGIYRPCCGNSTHFPDCNHGMAMLGLLELMASQGASEEEMWKAALAANAYWFPDTYVTIATYMKNKGIDWKDVNPQEVLGADYSSASGFRRVAVQVTVPRGQGGGGCSA